MIHQYKLNDCNIVLDINSGAIHSVDEVAYDMISLFKTKEKEEIINELLEKYSHDETVTKDELNECYNDIIYLEENEQIFTTSGYEDLHIKKTTITKPIVKALCFHVAHTCNLNCSYCFASQGRFNGNKGRAVMMDFEVGKRALDFLIENSTGRTHLEVDFFGGEPLMDWDVIKELVAYGRSLEPIHNKVFRFTLTTNGILIDDDVIEFSNKEMANVVLSLDGRKEVHDHLRKDYNEQGSYDIIVPKFKEFVEKREASGNKNTNYYMRGTYTHNNLDFTKDILHMAELGFKSLSMEPVVCDDSDPYALTNEDLPILFEQYEILAKEMIKRKKEGNEFEFYHYMLDLEHGPCIHKRITGCGAGTEYMAVTPWGELFPCHQFVGDETHCLGNIWDGVKEKDVQKDFMNCNIYSHEECDDCWAKYFCSGGCLANAFHGTGSINGVHNYSCELFKKRIECAIMMKVVET